MSDKRGRKKQIIDRVYELLGKYKQVAIVDIMNVTSNQVQQARALLRQHNSILIIGKNTVVKKAIKLRLNPPQEDDEDYETRRAIWKPLPGLERLSELLEQKIGLIFTDEPIFELKPLIESNRRPASAKVGVSAQCDYWVPAGPTGMDPSQISFFHVLQVPTKIQKAQIEIVKDVQVCFKGQKVGASQSALLQKLGLKPFTYGMEIKFVFDSGNVLTPEIFNITPTEILNKFRTGANFISALSLASGIPTVASLPHQVISAFKNLAAISLVTGYKFRQMDALTSAPAHGAPSNAAPGADKPKEAALAPKEEVKEEEEAEVEMGDLFGDDF